MSGVRPRVGVDFHVWDGIFQGSRSHLVGLYRSAIVQAPEIDFVFFLDGIDALLAAHAEFASPNVELVRMRPANGVTRLAVQLPWLRLRHRIDLLHLQYRLPLFKLGACACTIHDVLFETHPQFFSRRFVLQSRLTSRAAVRSADVLFTVSQYSRSEIARIYGVDAARIGVTANAVDARRFHPGTDGADAVGAFGLASGDYLLTVGRLEPRKNHLMLLEAYAGLGADAPLLVIAGQRDFGYEPVLQAITQLGLSGRVRLLEAVSDTTLPALMRHARVFVYPAFAEGFGMPVLEAMASGVPVITTDSTSLPEVAGSAGLLVPADSASALQSALRQVLDSAALRERMVAAGIAQASTFSWESSARVFVGGVRSFLAGQKLQMR